MIQPPKLLRVLGKGFKVQPGDLDGVLGLCHSDSGLLEVEQSLRPIEFADTLLHEVFHAILYCQGREEPRATEERFVRALSTGLIGVLRDNPDFAKWLCQHHPDFS